LGAARELRRVISYSGLRYLTPFVLGMSRVSVLQFAVPNIIGAALVGVFLWTAHALARMRMRMRTRRRSGVHIR